MYIAEVVFNIPYRLDRILVAIVQKALQDNADLDKVDYILSLYSVKILSEIESIPVDDKCRKILTQWAKSVIMSNYEVFEFNKDPILFLRWLFIQVDQSYEYNAKNLRGYFDITPQEVDRNFLKNDIKGMVAHPYFNIQKLIIKHRELIRKIVPVSPENTLDALIEARINRGEAADFEPPIVISDN